MSTVMLAALIAGGIMAGIILMVFHEVRSSTPEEPYIEVEAERSSERLHETQDLVRRSERVRNQTARQKHHTERMRLSVAVRRKGDRGNS